MTLSRFSPSDDIERVLLAVRDEGIAIVEHAVPESLLARLEADLAADLAAKQPGGGKFFGFKCKRLGGIAGRSPAFAEMAIDPLLLTVADGILLENCRTYQLQIASALQVWQGGELQPLHRDIGVYAPFLPRRPGAPEIMISLMWAVTDFTADNGATRLVPGSHLWEEGREARSNEEVQAVMPRGSLAIWRGSVLHGMAVNRTDRPRLGLVAGYSVGWLRQEENQYIVCPPEKAAALPERMQQLLGYQAHTPILGWVEDRDSNLLLRPGNRETENAAYDAQPLQYESP